MSTVKTLGPQASGLRLHRGRVVLSIVAKAAFKTSKNTGMLRKPTYDRMDLCKLMASLLGRDVFVGPMPFQLDAHNLNYSRRVA